MGVQVTFSYSAWAAQFPEFATVSQTLVTGTVLTLAQVYCRNDGGGPVSDANTQTALLNLMVAHLCAIFYGVNGAAPTGLVGRIASASEGSVNVGVDMPSGSPSAAWFNQTTYGAAFWAMSAQFRTMRYIPARR